MKLETSILLVLLVQLLITTPTVADSLRICMALFAFSFSYSALSASSMCC